ncbi:MAG: RluA family pseudouridine synthase [Mariprofundaceae bacterium]
MLELIIPETLHGQRLDYALAELTELSRSRVKALLKEGCVQGPLLKPSGKVQMGECYQLEMPDNKPLSLEPEDMALDILFEDEYLIVVNKPAGMVVHPSHGHDSGTLVHGLLYHCKNLPGINGVERPGIVHRIDKDTSGSLVVAKTEACHHGLVNLFATHDINRQYLTWCRGMPNWKQQRFESPIGRHPNHRQKMAVVENGKEAITDTLIEERFGRQFCRLRVTLQTGRTHQIRVHLSDAGLPILGDATYGRRFNPGKQVPSPASEAIVKLQRQALHAEVLGFKHPITGEEVECTASWPEDLRILDASLKLAYAG